MEIGVVEQVQEIGLPRVVSNTGNLSRSSKDSLNASRAQLSTPPEMPDRSRVTTPQLLTTVSTHTSQNALQTTFGPVIVDFDSLLQRFCSLISLPNFEVAHLSGDHRILIRDFLTKSDCKRILIYYSTASDLLVSISLPNISPQSMNYFLKVEMGQEVLSLNNFARKVHFGVLGSDTLQSLHKVMSHLYVPIFLGNTKWPDSVRKDFNNQIHKFMVQN